MDQRDSECAISNGHLCLFYFIDFIICNEA